MSPIEERKWGTESTWSSCSRDVDEEPNDDEDEESRV